MNSSRVVILVLALIALLFAFGVGAGALRSDDRGDIESGFVDWFTGLFEVRHPLHASDLVAPGFQAGAFALRPGLPVLAQVKQSDKAVREFALILVGGGEVEVEFAPKGDRGARVKSKLSANSPKLELQVFQQGATLTLRARTAGAGGVTTVRLELAQG